MKLLKAMLGESAGLNMDPSRGDAGAGLSALLVVMLIVLAVALLAGIVFIYRNTLGKRRRTTILEDYRKEAEECERSGRFISAADIYENRLKNGKRAAELYEKGGDYRHAALLYDVAGLPAKAKEMYQKDGDVEGAAEVSVLEGDYEDAARLYYDGGEKVDAAMLLEKAGRRMAAMRIYREAGEYRKAAQLMEEEGMFREAAEMFGISLRDKKVGDCTDDFYAYALKLDRAGDKGASLKVLREIERENPVYRDVKERIASLAPEPVEDVPVSGSTLRSFIRSGKIDPRHALKLWIHILRALQEAYKGGKSYGSLSPDMITIDANNNISFLRGSAPAAYIPPEIAKGARPDVCSDIYSSGVILYEMLIGSLEGLGSERISNKVEDVPEWLDEIVLKCLRKVREDRYQNIEIIFGDIKKLSHEKKTSEN
jgi:tetratricopeptide (TPR) repeat protein